MSSLFGTILGSEFTKDLRGVIKATKDEHPDNPRVRNLLDKLDIFLVEYGNKGLGFVTMLATQSAIPKKADPLRILRKDLIKFREDLAVLLVAAYDAILELQGIAAPAAESKERKEIEDLALKVVKKSKQLRELFKEFAAAEKARPTGSPDKRSKGKGMLSAFIDRSAREKQSPEAKDVFEVLGKVGVVLERHGIVGSFVDDSTALEQLLYSMLFRVFHALNVEDKISPLLHKGENNPQYFGMRSFEIDLLGKKVRIPSAAEIVGFIYRNIFQYTWVMNEETKEVEKAASFLEQWQKNLHKYIQYSMTELFEKNNMAPFSRIYKPFFATMSKDDMAMDAAKMAINEYFQAKLIADYDTTKDKLSTNNCKELYGKIQRISDKKIRELLTGIFITAARNAVIKLAYERRNVGPYIAEFCDHIRNTNPDLAQRVQGMLLEFICNEVMFGRKIQKAFWNDPEFKDLKNLIVANREFLQGVAKSKRQDIEYVKLFVDVISDQKDSPPCDQLYLAMYPDVRLQASGSSTDSATTAISSDHNTSEAGDGGGESEEDDRHHKPY